MPHVIVKMYPGRSEQQKSALVNEITRALKETVKCSDESISVAVEEISPEEWRETVYQKDILEKDDTLYKRPGY